MMCTRNVAIQRTEESVDTRADFHMKCGNRIFPMGSSPRPFLVRTLLPLIAPTGCPANLFTPASSAGDPGKARLMKSVALRFLRNLMPSSCSPWSPFLSRKCSCDNGGMTPAGRPGTPGTKVRECDEEADEDEDDEDDEDESKPSDKDHAHMAL